MANRGGGDIWTHPAILILVGLALSAASVAGLMNGNQEPEVLVIGVVGLVLLVGGLIAVGGRGGRKSSRGRGSRRR